MVCIWVSYLVSTKYMKGECNMGETRERITVQGSCELKRISSRY